MPNTLLLIEDEAIIRLSTVRMFQKQSDLRILHTGTPEAAINIIKTEKPDYMVVDINLNDSLNGVDIVKDAYTGYKPIVFFLSAYEESSYHSVLSGVEYSGYFLKPVNARIIDTIVEKCRVDS